VAASSIPPRSRTRPELPAKKRNDSRTRALDRVARSALRSPAVAKKRNGGDDTEVTLADIARSIQGAERSLRAEMFGVEERLRGEIVGVEERLRGEIVGVEERLRGEIVGTEERLRGEIVGTEERLRGEIVGTEERLRGEMVGTEERLRGEMGGIEGRLGRRLDRVEANQHAMLQTLRQHGGRISKLEGKRPRRRPR
jgi:hypothetical protein